MNADTIWTKYEHALELHNKAQAEDNAKWLEYKRVGSTEALRAAIESRAIDCWLWDAAQKLFAEWKIAADNEAQQ